MTGTRSPYPSGLGLIDLDMMGSRDTLSAAY